MLGKRNYNEVLRNSRIPLKERDGRLIHQGDAKVIYQFKEGLLIEIIVNAKYHTEFLGISSGDPEDALRKLGYQPIGKRDAGAKEWFYWTKDNWKSPNPNIINYVVVSRDLHHDLIELMYARGAITTQLEPVPLNVPRRSNKKSGMGNEPKVLWYDDDLSKAKVIFKCAPIQPPKGFDHIPLVSYAFDEFEEQHAGRTVQSRIEVGEDELTIIVWLRADSSDDFTAMRASFEKVLRRRQLLGPITVPTSWRWQFGQEPITIFFSRMSRAIIEEHGPLLKAVFLNRYPKFEIEFWYADGTCIFSGKRSGNTDIHYLTFGYVGDGPRFKYRITSRA